MVEIQALTHDVKEVSLRLIDPQELDFIAGQYVAIEVSEVKDGQTRLNNRPYSIVSPPEEKKVIKLCANLIREGPGSTYLHGLRLGDQVQFLYPLGYFRIDDQSTTSLLFVATGTGIAPIKSIILHLLKNGSRRPITLYWGLRREEDIYYQDEFTSLAYQYPFFKFRITLSQPSPGWKGLKGRVTHYLADGITTVENLEVALCGKGEMIREVRGILMGKGMSKKSIHFEKFYN